MRMQTERKQMRVQRKRNKRQYEFQQNSPFPSYASVLATSNMMLRPGATSRFPYSRARLYEELISLSSG